MAERATVIDSSALIALAKDEDGASDIVPGYLAFGQLTLEGLAEFVGVLGRNGLVPEPFMETFEAAGLTVVAVSRSAAWRAGELALAPKMRHISLADRLCVAHASELGLPLLTTDRVWAELDLAVDVILARRPT